MAENQTRPTGASVEAFLDAVEGERKRQDSYKVLEMMKQATGKPAEMWGPAIIGFGSQHYRYESGREGDMPLMGFSPRKQSLTLYLPSGFEREDELLGKLGKHKTSKACLYINKLSDVDEAVLRELIEESMAYLKQKGMG